MFLIIACQDRKWKLESCGKNNDKSGTLKPRCRTHQSKESNGSYTQATPLLVKYLGDKLYQCPLIDYVTLNFKHNIVFI